MKILFYKPTPEYEAMVAFLQWQHLGKLECESNPRIIAESNGTTVPIVYKEDKRIARGFKGLVQYWDQQGLWLL